MENLKKMAGIKAAEFVNDGMVVGLGTGSTAYYFVEEIGRRIKEEGLVMAKVALLDQATRLNKEFSNFYKILTWGVKSFKFPVSKAMLH